MRLGIDLDNTLICYDELFAALAEEAGILKSGASANKQAIRDHLRATGREDYWTRMQGLAYGTRMCGAECFPGAAKFLQQCREQGIEWFIISHRSQVPYLGDPVDLHESARQWLMTSGLVQPDDLNRVFLELTLADKLSRIREVQCDVFIDDLVELLTHPEFPQGTDEFYLIPKIKILIGPNMNEYNLGRGSDAY